MAVSTIGGNVLGAAVLTASLTPASVGAATSAEQTFTVPGLNVGDFVAVSGSVQNGIGITASRVTAANTLGIRFVNATAGALTPTAGTYQVLVVRPETGTFTGFAP